METAAGQGTADTSSGCHPLAGGQKRHKPCSQGQSGSSCALLWNTWKPGSLAGYPSAVTLQYPRGGILASLLPQIRFIKGRGAAFLERSGSSWRAAVVRGQDFPLLFYSCLMFWKIFRKMTLTVLCQTGWGWKKMKFGRDVIHSACSLDDIQWLTQEF